MNKSLLITTFLLWFVILFAGCSVSQKSYFKIASYTQGTTYHITYENDGKVNLQPFIDTLLRRFDMSLSTYEKNSIISRINHNDSTVVADDLFAELFKCAQQVSETTDGAFDITIAPLADFWGFGSGKKHEAVDSAKVDSLRELVGYKKIRLVNGKLIKDNPNITLNVNAIAQGYAVDVVARYLEDEGVENYMVEIGGEVRVKGHNAENKLWRIGIDKPQEDASEFERQLQTIIQLQNKSLATSGNYRQFYVENGIKYSHTINPATGYPIRSKLLSATIIADDCMSADAYATACMVMGLEKSIELVKQHKELEAYFIFINDAGKYEVYYSDGIKDMLQAVDEK